MQRFEIPNPLEADSSMGFKRGTVDGNQKSGEAVDMV